MAPQYNYMIPEMFGLGDQLSQLLDKLLITIAQAEDKESIILEISREIDDIYKSNSNRDQASAKTLSTFLTSLLESYPNELVQALHYIFNYLELDSYLMRNTSLVIMGTLIVKILHREDQDKNQREEVLDALSEHIRDVNGYTRAKALSVWCMLCENGCIPLNYVIPVTDAAVGRLRDKTCLVRKNALRFIINIIGRNAYAVEKLPLSIFLNEYEIQKAKLDKMKEDEKEEEAETLSQSSTISSDHTQEGSEAPSSKIVVTEATPIAKQEKKVTYLQDVVAFIKSIHKAIPLALDLLSSKNITDVQEAIDFFVTCHDFGVENAMVGYKRMILLIDAQENSIRESILLAYKRIFFNTIESKTKERKDSLIVAKFIEFIKLASIGQYMALENLMAQFIANKDFTKDMRDELWARYTKRKPNITEEDQIAAIQIVGIIAKTDPGIINQNMQWCVSYGLSSSGSTEPESRLIRETCIAIRKSLPRKIDDRTSKRTMRLARDDKLFIRLEEILVESFTSTVDNQWFSMCDEAVKIMFDLAEHPEQICESIFSQLSVKLLRHAIQNNTMTQDTNGDDSPDLDFNPSSMQTSQNHTTELVRPIELARFIHFLGDFALNMAVYLELHVLLELKMRSVPNNDTSLNNISAHNLSISSRRRSLRYSMGGQNLEEEIGLGGAEAEDTEMEFVSSICDEEIVCGKNLLASMSRVIIEVTSDPVKYHQPELKRASSLALAKYMMVSAKFCHDHLRLLFTILSKSKDKETKINLLIAISDLCVRFPNQLDGWTGRMFECLQSGDVSVRRVALKIISRLVLCDILKAKSQTSVMANLIVDEDDHIALYSRHFFLELSKKQNAIYNVLPDIISRLSDSKDGISQDKFKVVMRFIFELIDKSHHIDRLVDKLCGRFMDTDDERHWEDLAYCLSLLKYSEKSMSKLFDKFDCYKDKICIDGVRQHILSAITNFRKTPSLKNETKVILDEFEAKISKARGEQNDAEDQLMDQDGQEGAEVDLDETDITADQTDASDRASSVRPTPAKVRNRTRTRT